MLFYDNIIYKLIEYIEIDYRVHKKYNLFLFYYKNN